jgi:DNA-binding NtrC family response regulator
MIFCSLFFQQINANKNLLDVKKDKELKIPPLPATKIIQKPNSSHFKLEKEIFEYLLGKRLAKDVKQLPAYDSREFQDLMTSATNIDKIDDCINIEKLLSTLSKEELDKLHVKAVLKRTGGNVRQAAKIMDIAWSTLNESLKKYKLGKFSEI